MKIVEARIDESVLPKKDKDWKFALAANAFTEGWIVSLRTGAARQRNRARQQRADRQQDGCDTPEHCELGVSLKWRHDVRARRALLPLPEGEGWGEGVTNLDSAVTPSPPPSPQLGRGSPTAASRTMAHQLHWNML